MTKTTMNLKIYIDQYNPANITKQILNKLNDHYKFTKTFQQLYSSSGIFLIQNNKISQKTPYDKPIRRHIFDENIGLLLDDSYFKEEHVLSQIPYDHVIKNTTAFYYCLGEKSNLYMVIEGDYNSKINTDKLCNFVPDNLYFLANEEIDNYLIKKELNVFLSMLN